MNMGLNFVTDINNTKDIDFIKKSVDVKSEQHVSSKPINWKQCPDLVRLDNCWPQARDS